MNEPSTTESRSSALTVVRDQFGQSIAATKCHGCGCLLPTIDALEKTAPTIPELGSVLHHARRVLAPKKYDCLGCDDGRCCQRRCPRWSSISLALWTGQRTAVLTYL